MKRTKLKHAGIPQEIGIAFYEDRLRINKTRIDEELVEQPKLYFAVNEQAILERSRHTALKDDLASLEAKLYRRYAAAMEAKGERITDTAIAKSIQTNEERHAAFLAMLKQDETAKRWEALTDTFQDRSFALKSIAQLYCSGWMSDTSVRGPAVNAVRDQAYEERRTKMKAGRKPVVLDR